MVYIYGLFDPRNLELRYIGKTDNPNERLLHHIRSSRNNRGDNPYKERWIRQLLSENLKPAIEILEECSDDSWSDIEKAWIKEAREKGARLTNVNEGGEHFGSGRKGMKSTEEHRRKVSKALTGKKLSPEHIEKIRQIKSNISEETRQKISKAHKGKKLSEEHKAKIKSKPMLGKHHSEETKEKISRAKKGKPGPNKGKAFSEKHRENMRKSRIGRISSEEAKRKMSESAKRGWEKRRANVK